MRPSETTSTGPSPPRPGLEHSPVGVVDLGSNAIRVLIAEWVGADQPPRLIESHRAPVSLGRDVFLTGTISDATTEAAIDVLRKFTAACERHGVAHVRAIATSAMRDSRNRADVLERIRDECGIDLEVVSGSEEAYLLTVATQTRIDLQHGRSLLVDLGGGSVEVSLVQNGEVVFAESYQLGALRILRALTDDGGESVGESFFDMLDEYVAAVADRIEEHFAGSDIDRYIATGGNIESIAVILARTHRLAERDGVEVCRLRDVKELARELSRLSHSERMAAYELRPERADTILPAAVVYYRIGRAAGVDRVFVPRVGLREGLMEEAFAHVRSESRAATHREILLSACRSLGRRYHFDADHAETVRRLAVRLYDQTESLHGLGARERTLLEAAALLHDIGVFIGNSRHHKHSSYLIQASDIVGLGDRSRAVVAQVVRYHRRAHPNAKHVGWNALPEADREVVAKLAALLRLADSLDRGHRSKVDDVEVAVRAKTVELRARLRTGVESDLMLERLGVREKSRLFQEVFARRVRVAIADRGVGESK